MKEVKRNRHPIVEPNWLDRAITVISPTIGAKRMRSRYMMAMAESYTGASKRRSSMAEWVTSQGDADTDISYDLPELRERSRDLVRNNALAAGALNTKCTNVVGTGLMLNAQIDRDILGLTEEAAKTWERKTEAEWRLFSESVFCDASQTQNFSGIQDLAFRSVKENGDVVILTPMSGKSKPYSLQLQMIEADRLSNKDGAADTETLVSGIAKDEKTGAPIEYHIQNSHPGNINNVNMTWKVVKAYGPKSGRKNVIHIYYKRRVGQSRGVPDFAPVIELFKQLGRYTESEVNAAVISSFFTVFFKSEDPGGLKPMQPTSNVGGKTTDKDYKMASGAMLDLLPGEDISIANPGRPNSEFDPFVQSVLRQIGVALELPFEILIKHFTASYSAARAALEEAWRYYTKERKFLADGLCKPVYELFMDEAVALGRIAAPGYLTGDPLIRKAWLGSFWIGPAKTQIDEKKAVDAAAARVKEDFSTRQQETMALTGGDWEQNYHQRVAEEAMRKAGGLTEQPEVVNEKVVSDPGEER